MKGTFIFLADGFEDVEALGVCDVLRRGGVDVRLVGLSEGEVKSSHGVRVMPDMCLDEALAHAAAPEGDKDVMIFPGGMPGSKNLAACAPLMDEARRHYARGGTLAAICAAPGLVLGQIDVPAGSEFTCFDGFQDALLARGAKFTGRPAVRSGRIISGRSAGHAFTFGLEILRLIRGEAVAAEVSHALYLD